MGLKDNILTLETIEETLPTNPLEHEYTAGELRDILDGRAEDNAIRTAINAIIESLTGTGGADEIGTSRGQSVETALEILEESMASHDEVEGLKTDVENVISLLENKADVATVATAQENITAIIQAMDYKVDKESGKGLSEADFTHTEKEKLSGIEVGAQQNKVNTVCGVQPQGGNVTLTAANVPAAQGDDFSVAYYIDMLTKTTDELIGSQGDIDSALDSILAIENSLIGGEGA